MKLPVAPESIIARSACPWIWTIRKIVVPFLPHTVRRPVGS